jgi:hypothetical protein
VTQHGMAPNYQMVHKKKDVSSEFTSLNGISN